MTRIELAPAEPYQLETLSNLFQLYLYDFSVYFCDDPGEQIGEDGLYDPGFEMARYFEPSGYRAYLGRVDGRLAGFALVTEQVQHRVGPGRLIEDFFVLRCYRRRGVGRSMAFQLFDTFRGYWEIAQIASNKPAQAFWRKVIGEYTQRRYREFVAAPNRYGDDVWQVFDSSEW
jgi:predicted acetyltransferase